MIEKISISVDMERLISTVAEKHGNQKGQKPKNV